MRSERPRLHDWTAVEPGAFAQFHNAWITGLCRRLNNGGLPGGYGAHSERIVRPGGPDVLVAETADGPPRRSEGGGVAVAAAATATAPVIAYDESDYRTSRQNRLVIRGHDRGVVAITEIVSAGNKDSRRRFDRFIEKALHTIDSGTHLSVVDVHPPGRLDPRGMVDAVWEAASGQDTELPGRAAATIRVDEGNTLYAEPWAIGRPVTDVPLFLDGDQLVRLPLEEAYGFAMESMPPDERRDLERTLD